MNEKLDAIMADPCVSYWVKDAIRILMQRDVLDALNDVRLLHKIMLERWVSMRGQGQ